MKQPNIALIGARATGKTTVGQILAERLGRTFIDMDRRLVASAGREISAWVNQEGWGPFRKAESELLRDLSSREGLVVSTGGGIVVDPENIEILSRRFFTVWLKATAQTIHSRMSADPASGATRPPLSDLGPRAEIEKVLLDRAALYSKAADFEVDTEGVSTEEVADAIIQKLVKCRG